MDVIPHFTFNRTIEAGGHMLPCRNECFVHISLLSALQKAICPAEYTIEAGALAERCRSGSRLLISIDSLDAQTPRNDLMHKGLS
jgi:hypothetical protein